MKAKLAVYEERINNNASSTDEQRHASLLRLRALEEQLVASK